MTHYFRNSKFIKTWTPKDSKQILIQIYCLWPFSRSFKIVTTYAQEKSDAFNDPVKK